MKVLTISLPPIMTNCYLAFECEGGKCFIIDPASNAEKIIEIISSASLSPTAILLTHGHFDHIEAADILREHYSIPLLVHEGDADMIKSPTLNCSMSMMGTVVKLKDADGFLKDGDEIKLENEGLRIMHTPGHSPGSCVFIADNLIFSGDTVFRSTYGRYDLPGGDYMTLMRSIIRIMSLDEGLIVYPGHDEKTTIAREKIYY